MADAFTPNFNLTLPEVGASFDTWGTKLNNNLSTLDKFLVPVGGIIMWSGAVIDIPNNWALCDGLNGTPDLRDMFVVGAGGAYAVGATGGAASVTLTEAQLAAHSHAGSTGSAGGHSHGGATGNAGSHNHGGSTGNAGGHSHSLSINSNGNHSHTGSANSAGSHTHALDFGAGSGTHADPARASSSSAATGSTLSAGAHTHSLSINSNGSHSHTGSTSTQASHGHSIPVQADHSHSIPVQADHSHTVTVGNTGGGESHENRPPYYALAWIMNIG